LSGDPRYPVHAPGWAAIDRALERVHPSQTPHQFTSERPYDLAGKSPLPAITVWEGRAPHCWHYVTYGLSELFEKSTDVADISGFGFELTFRLPRPHDQEQPPRWPVVMMQGVAHYVMSGHGALDTGHTLDFAGPLSPEPLADGRATALEGVILVPDPQLGKIDTELGSVLFLTMWGMTKDELQTVQGWELARKVGLVAEVEPAGVTDPARMPMREDRRAQTILRRYEAKILI
jgi:hypothetical protein